MNERRGDELDGAMTTAEDAAERPFRIQAAMVLFALEEALGAYVVQAAPEPEALPDGVKAEIEKRIQGSGFVPVTQIVQKTYIKEVIDLAIGASKERSESDALTRLRKLIEALDTFEIRNAVCHPNRLFPECYWHRMAALATDPAIEQLRLRKVTDAFRCAADGRLTPPPEGWLQQRSWNVANNLPSTFDHQVTGLIARKSEAKDLKKRLTNLRNSLIAIVGPGGTGKTALCLDVLRDCVLDPATLEWADEVVYVTAKTEQLTAQGVQPITDPLTSLDSVKEAIALALLEDVAGDDSDAFDVATKEMGSRRLLLCVDNLETLLREHPQDFEEFVQSLPRDWRVLVTSRVTVNGANVLSLGPIRRDGAMTLARNYTSIRGAGRLEEDQLARLVDICDRNPLAIRLAVDSYAAGSELAKALEQTKERITDFSYTSLLEHLPEDADKVLECLFGSNAALTRGQIGHLLDLVPDDVAEAVNSLLRTSLVTRGVDGTTERYSLSSSVRDLLLRVPRDARVRQEVYARLRDQQRLLTELDRKGTRDTLDESYVPPGAPDHVRALVARVKRSVSGRGSRMQQVSDLGEVRRAIEFDAGQAILHRTEALLLEQLNDRFGAIEALNKSVRCDAPDPAARLKLAELLRDDQRLEEALEHTKPLMEQGLLDDDTVSQRNRTRLLRAHWVSALWLKQYDAVLEATKGWRNAGDLRPAFVALRVSAQQRFLDDQVLGSGDQESVVADLVGCLSEGFRLDGYLPDVVHEGFRAVDRLRRLWGRRQLCDAAALRCAEFLNEHLAAMCGTSYDCNLDDDETIDLVRAFRAVGTTAGNPLCGGRWDDLVDQGAADDAALASAGYERSRVTAVFPDRGYVFARALDGSRDFYVHRRSTELNSNQFVHLKQGQLMMVLPSGEPPDSGRAWPAKHAMLE